MAGDWVKMDTDLHEKPEVLVMADHLSADTAVIVGCLHRIWSWFSSHTTDGNAPGVTPAFLDRLVAREGFAAELSAVGWLMHRNGSLSVPKFDRHNSKSAKERALTRDRVKRQRNAQSVTTPLPEKRREEKEKSTDSTSGAPPAPRARPTIEEWLGYAREIDWLEDDARSAFDHYQSNGWKVGGKTPVKDWKAAARNCQRRGKKSGAGVGRFAPPPMA